MIPYINKNINKEDINSVVEVMESDFSSRPVTPIFEEGITIFLKMLNML